MYDLNYMAQVRLLIYCLPFLKSTKQFALKGGTAINFFIQNMPRLSVDIDLTYVLLDDREIAINGIETGLLELSKIITEKLMQSKVEQEIGRFMKNVVRLRVIHGRAQIKIEPNFIVRGALYPTVERDLCQKAIELFDLSVKKVHMLSDADIYAGKICAALKRQHPRDLFDIKVLFENQGLTDEIRKAFIVYLASDSKPIHELLDPNLKDLTHVYENEFANMTIIDVSLPELLETRNKLIRTIHNDLTEQERYFFLSIKKGEPNFSLLPFNNLDKLPCLKWKLLNIRKLDKNKHQRMIDKLRYVLQL